MRNTLLTLTCFLWAAGAQAQLFGGNSPKVYSRDGKYLGNLNSNPLDPNSVSNPIGRYGSSISPDSINNPIGRYGSSISNQSVNNPLATQSPVLVAPSSGLGRRQAGFGGW